MKKYSNKYEGVSLVEMLITLVIITVVMLLAMITLTTLIRTSAVINARTTARQESEFVIELLRRSIRNSDSSDIFIYNVQNRYYDEALGAVINSGVVSGYDAPLDEGTNGTEIQFRPSGYDRWICIGYFPVKDKAGAGYIVKSSMEDNSNPSGCLDSGSSGGGQAVSTNYAQNAVVLNSSEVYVDQFTLSYYGTTSDNLLINVAVKMKSIYPMSFSKNLEPAYFKQSIISTQKLTWE